MTISCGEKGRFSCLSIRMNSSNAKVYIFHLSVIGVSL
ncbi:hypothetical protein A4U88_5225 [Serratia marcescens]|nr:hypothetical protein A4U88_5225 [Serratia marcescens]AXK25267.1 Hypothetical protein SmN45_3524 [Serratia marcescens]